MKRMLIYCFIILFITTKIEAIELSMRSIDQKNFKEDPFLETEMRKIYISAFSNIYSSEWSEDFECYMLKYYNTYCNQFKNDNRTFLCCCIADNIVCGWMFFDNYNNGASIKLICIDPAYQRQGIGKKLILSIKQLFPEIDHITVTTRKSNSISPLFYQALGFKNTGIVLSEDGTEEMLLFEWYLNE